MTARIPQSTRGLLWGWAICLACGCGGSAPSEQPPKRTKPATSAVPSRDVPLPSERAPVEDAPSQQAASPEPVTQTVETAVPQQIVRPSDARPRHDDERLQLLGIRKYESKRLKLYTDIDPAVAETLPVVIDRAYEALESYFGALPPDRERTDFQMTGYLIRDDALFREAGLIPEDLPRFEHGRHRRNEFWMREQQYDYYRRHLLIHEVTHCFMTYMPDVEAPVWYMEGMAECFGTHRTQPDGTIEFRVMPTSPEGFAGSGRITVIRNDCSKGEAKSIPAILDLRADEFLKTEYYAWSWGLCMFLDTHPRYRDRFRKLGGYLQRNAFPTEFHRAFGNDLRDLATEWALYSRNLQYGYDIVRSAIEFRSGTELASSQPEREVLVKADRGWQSSGVLLREGEMYTMTTSGRFELAQEPKPWVSEAQGISFRYFEGRPLGMLLGCIRSEDGESGGELDSMLKVEALGRGGVFTAPVTGTMYFRVNDEWNSLSNNRGEVTVRIRLAERSPEEKR